MRGVVGLCLLILCTPTGGAAWVGGILQGLHSNDAVLTAGEMVLFAGDEQAEGGSARLDIQAERIDATLTSINRAIVIDEVGGTSRGQEHRWENETWHDVTVTGTERRAQYRLVVAGSGTVLTSSQRLNAAAHNIPTLEEPDVSPHNKELLEFNVSRLHSLTQIGGRVDFTGDFTVSLWEWDVLLANATDQRRHWTGQRLNDTISGTPIQNDENRRLYLNVTNGTLSLPLAGLDVTHFFVAGSLLDAASAVLDVARQETSIVLDGPVHMGLEPVRDGLFLGSILEVPEEGPSVAPGPRGKDIGPATTATSAGSAPWTTGLVLLSLAAAALVAWRALRVVRLRRAMEGGDYRAVAVGAGLEASRRFGPEVVVARVVSMVKTGEYAAAAALLERHGDRLAIAVRAYLWACIHAGRGEVEEAREAVVRSLLADPGMAVEVESNTALRRFVADADAGGYS